VRIAAALLGLSDRIDIAGVDLNDPEDSIRVQNPLGKIPTLVLEDGSSLYDSRVIVDYLDHLAGGGKLVAADAEQRFATLRLQALGDGISDAALLLRYEFTVRPEPSRHAPTIALQQGKIDRALAYLDAAPPQGPVDIGHIALACALGYLDLRFEGAWRADHPNLVSWLQDFADKVHAFDATKA
jgi:glutathione S-transferase